MGGSITQDVFVLGEGFEERRRTTSAGTKSRFTLSVRVDPVILNLSEISLGKGPAEALRLAISNGIKAVGSSVSLATSLKRKYLKAAFERGESYAVKQYRGGRIGNTPPTDSDQLFVNSGRFANGVFVRQNPKEQSWTVNVPANRMNESTFTRDALIRFADMLRQRVPVLRAPLEHPDVKRAISSTLDQMIAEADARTWRARYQLIKSAVELVKTAGDIVGLGR